MVEKILITAINYLVPVILGFLISKISSLKKKEKATDIALRTLLQNSLTNMYFVYSEKKQIPDYVFKNWNNLFKIYKELNGNDYCDTLKRKMESWEIVSTDILK